LSLNKKQYSVWAHPRSGSTWICNIFNSIMFKKFPLADYHIVTPAEFLLRAPNKILHTEWNANKNRDVYAVWKIISPYHQYRIDLNDVLSHTVPIALGRRKWQNSVISWIKADQNGIWNSNIVEGIPTFNVDVVTEEQIYHIMRLLSNWYYEIKRLEIPVVWYEDLTFTVKDLEIYGFDSTEFLDFYDKNLVKKITNDNDYKKINTLFERFDFDKIMQETNFPKNFSDLKSMNKNRKVET